uniref:Anoctamin 3 n=1 Tax=Echeneis naucrates TaxID=173247 RepID=A0A665V6B4_ECHNA
MVHHSGSIQSFKQQKGMHTSISEILKEKSLKPSRRSLPCLAQSQTHPINLNHFLSVPLSPEPKPEVNGLSQSISTSCSLLPPQTGKLNANGRVWFLSASITISLIVLCLCAAEDGKDHYVEESEVTTCETRADESFLLQKPATRAKLEARTDSLQPAHSSGLFFRDGKKRIEYILVYKKSSAQVEKRCTFEKNLRAEGLMLEKERGALML